MKAAKPLWRVASGEWRARGAVFGVMDFEWWILNFGLTARGA